MYVHMDVRFGVDLHLHSVCVLSILLYSYFTAIKTRRRRLQ